MAEGPVFIVGAGRSGTTLLRLMLDAHPSFALPPETHFVVALTARRLRLQQRPEIALDRVLAHPRFALWGLDGDLIRAVAADRPPADLASLFRIIFETYAEAHGKPRWGDKTPGYVEHLPLLAQMFPDARFIHIIRDGRAVATSVASKPWGPPTAVSAAWWWRGCVRQGRRDGALLGPRYLEVRYEALVADPIGVLSTVCRHLGTDYDPAMLDYWRTASERLPAGTTEPGRPHERTLLPPTTSPNRFMTLPERERRAVEHACRPLLSELGYNTDDPQPSDAVNAWVGWGTAAVRRVPQFVTDRVRPGRRSI